jgi:hypothetical protein
MYAFSTRTKIPPVNFGDPADCKQIFCWRKHPNLHGWMERLYWKKRGWFQRLITMQEWNYFNLVNVRLDASDIDRLEAAVRQGRLPHTVGFFFGQSQPHYASDDLKFIHRARQALASGRSVFYTSFW